MSSEVLNYVTKAQEYVPVDYEKFMYYISIAHHYAEGDNSQITNVLVELANGYYAFKKYEKCIELIDSIFLENLACGDAKFDLMRLQGISFGNIGKLKEAIGIFESLAQEDSVEVKIMGLGNLGWIYNLLVMDGEKDEYVGKVITCCKEALRLINPETHSKLWSDISINLGTAYWYGTWSEKALEIFLEAEKVMPEYPKLLNNIASLYVGLNNNEMAQEYLKRSEKIAERQNDLCTMGHINRIQGWLAETLIEDYMMAKEYYLIAHDYFLSIDALFEASTCFAKNLELNELINKESLCLLSQKLKTKYNMQSVSMVLGEVVIA